MVLATGMVVVTVPSSRPGGRDGRCHCAKRWSRRLGWSLSLCHALVPL